MEALLLPLPDGSESWSLGLGIDQVSKVNLVSNALLTLFHCSLSDSQLFSTQTMKAVLSKHLHLTKNQGTQRSYLPFPILPETDIPFEPRDNLFQWNTIQAVPTLPDTSGP